MDIFMLYLGAFLVSIGLVFAWPNPEIRGVVLMILGIWINLRAVLVILSKAAHRI